VILVTDRVSDFQLYPKFAEKWQFEQSFSSFFAVDARRSTLKNHQIWPKVKTLFKLT